MTQNAPQFIAFWTLLKKEIRRFMRIWKQTLIPPVINQSLYFVIFGSFIGSQLSNINGVSYMAYIIPGLILMSMISNSFSNVSSSFYGEKFQHSIEELFVSPIKKSLIILGYTLGGVTRGLIIGLIVWAVSAFFVTPQIHNLGIILVFGFLTTLLFSLAGLTIGIFGQSFDDITFVPTFILTPLTYLGGVFYDITSLPDLWRTISYFNPIVYMIDGFRYGFYGTSFIPPIYSFAVVSVFCVAFMGLNFFLLHKGKQLNN
jgi:ABC-2 type transport system permease protein